jgi:hypothetical protein
MRVNNELERIWKKRSLFIFKIRSFHLHGETERSYDKCQCNRYAARDSNIGQALSLERICSVTYHHQTRGLFLLHQRITSCYFYSNRSQMGLSRLHFDDQRKQYVSVYYVSDWNFFISLRTASAVKWSEFLAPDPEVPGSIPGATRFSEK